MKRTLLIATAVLASVSSAHAGLFDLFSSKGLKEPLRTSFIKAFVAECTPMNRKGYSPQVFLNYCTCAAEKAADIATEEEAISNDIAVVGSFMAKLKPVVAACRRCAPQMIKEIILAACLTAPQALDGDTFRACGISMIGRGRKFYQDEVMNALTSSHRAK